MVGDRGRLKRLGSRNRLRGQLDAMERLTQRVRVAIVELNVVSGVDARPIAVLTMNATASASVSRMVLDVGRGHRRDPPTARSPHQRR
jgi:hypothetical protein